MAPRLETGEASVPLLGREEGLLGAVLRFRREGLGVRMAPPCSASLSAPELAERPRGRTSKVIKAADLRILIQTHQAQVTAFKHRWVWGRRAR